jgi:hypothetical protein
MSHKGEAKKFAHSGVAKGAAKLLITHMSMIDYRDLG